MDEPISLYFQKEVTFYPDLKKDTENHFEGIKVEKNDFIFRIEDLEHPDSKEV